MAKTPPVLKLYQNFAKRPYGKQLFSKAIAFKAPYFSSIGAVFKELKPGYAEISMRKRRAVTNHIGTVHAIAMCNCCELAGGTMCEVTVPTTHRWIPKGMEVDYLKKANSDLRTVATVDTPERWEDGMDLIVNCDVIDSNGVVVVTARIKMWITAKS